EYIEGFAEMYPLRLEWKVEDGRAFKKGEKLLALDGKEYELDGGMTVIADDEGVRTWAQLDSRVNRLVHALRSAGLGQGDTISVVAGNRNEWFEVALACSHAGVVFVPVSWHLVASEMAYIIETPSNGVVVIITNQPSHSVGNKSVLQTTCHQYWTLGRLYFGWPKNQFLRQSIGPRRQQSFPLVVFALRHTIESNFPIGLSLEIQVATKQCGQETHKRRPKKLSSWQHSNISRRSRTNQHQSV
ncbi:MAG TPA: hypothetical protein EYN66_09895, partial [Myxococcales bacterium]|nr:hypothetical protein [Myxococcales bacterium]